MSANRSSTRAKSLLAGAPVIPVITIDRASDAVPLARALVKGGLRVIEITLRTDAAMAAAAAVIAEVPDAVIGIGTVLTSEDLDRARKAGAAFAISPGYSDALLRAAASGDFAYVPGIQTASDLIACVTSGFDVVKFFPAVSTGGIPALNALSGPFPSVTYCPTGGIGEANAAEWLAHPKVVAVGGSWIAPASAIAEGDWQAIEARARAAGRLRAA